MTLAENLILPIFPLSSPFEQSLFRYLQLCDGFFHLSESVLSCCDSFMAFSPTHDLHSSRSPATLQD